MVRGVDGRSLATAFGTFGHDQPGVRQPDPLDPAGQEPKRGIDRRDKRELEARGAAVDRQDARPSAVRTRGRIEPASDRDPWAGLSNVGPLRRDEVPPSFGSREAAAFLADLQGNVAIRSSG